MSKLYDDVVKTIQFSPERVDRLAEDLVPEHYRQVNVKPITTTSDGNCLFNAASLALCGSEAERRTAVAYDQRTCSKYRILQTLPNAS